MIFSSMLVKLLLEGFSQISSILTFHLTSILNGELMILRGISTKLLLWVAELGSLQIGTEKQLRLVEEIFLSQLLISRRWQLKLLLKLAFLRRQKECTPMQIGEGT